MTQIGAAVVGLGGNGMGAARAALDSPYVRQLIGVDLDAARCAAARETIGIETTTRYAEVLADPDIQLIYVSTSNASHHSVSKAALEHGKKVLTEKPMGITMAETEDLLQTVHRTRGWLGVGFELRHYSTLYVRIKDIIDSGEIGRLTHINCQYSASPYGNTTEKERWKHNRALSGGIFQEKLCHYIDLPRWWDGTRVARYVAVKAENVLPYYGVADNVELTYQFASGTVSHLTFTMNAAGPAGDDTDGQDVLTRQIDEGYRLSYQLIGTEGALEANVFHRQLRVFHHPGKGCQGDRARLLRRETWSPAEDHAYFHNTTAEKQDAARRVALGLPPAIDPADAAETMRLCYEFEDALLAPWAVVERGTEPPPYRSQG